MSAVLGQSSIRAEAWLPVLDGLLHGVVHAANNRVAAMNGLMQLQDLSLATPAEGVKSMREETGKLRTLMERFRDLQLRRGDHKEPSRISDAFKKAQPLMALHTSARNWALTVADEPEDVEPVLMWPSDPLRFACLLILAAASGPTPSEIYVGILRSGEMTEVMAVVRSPATAVEASAEYRALAEGAAREGGSLTVTPTNGDASVTITLALPGLSRASRSA